MKNTPQPINPQPETLYQYALHLLEAYKGGEITSTPGFITLVDKDKDIGISLSLMKEGREMCLYTGRHSTGESASAMKSRVQMRFFVGDDTGDYLKFLMWATRPSGSQFSTEEVSLVQAHDIITQILQFPLLEINKPGQAPILSLILGRETRYCFGDSLYRKDIPPSTPSGASSDGIGVAS